MILDEIREIKGSKKDLRKFGLTIGIAFVLLALLLFITKKSSFPYFGSLGLLLILIGLAAPVILKPLNKIWMSLAIVLGWIMTRVILIILFYLAVTPIGLLVKLFRKDFLDMKIDKNKDSYWQKRERKKFDPLDFERQF
jgi:hypothetical protein